jgi:hypothetical protein
MAIVRGAAHGFSPCHAAGFSTAKILLACRWPGIFSLPSLDSSQLFIIISE